MTLAILCLWFTAFVLAQSQQPVEQVPTDKSAPPPKDNREARRAPTMCLPGRAPASRRKSTSPRLRRCREASRSRIGQRQRRRRIHSLQSHEGDEGRGGWRFLLQVKQNYPAAISRYREALEYKPHDAEATFKLAEVLNKTGDTAGAVENYEEYLKILPNGPYAKKAREESDKLKDEDGAK